jgi:hypothetical protein
VALYCATPRLEAALADGPLSTHCPYGHDLVFAPGWWCEDYGGCCCASCANASGVLSRLISWPKRRAEGGSNNSLRVRISFVRRKLAGTPFAIAGAYGTGYGLFPAADVAVTRNRRGHGYVRLRPRLDPQALSDWAADRGWQPPGPSKGGGGIGRARRSACNRNGPSCAKPRN